MLAPEQLSWQTAANKRANGFSVQASRARMNNPTARPAPSDKQEDATSQRCDGTALTLMITSTKLHAWKDSAQFVLHTTKCNLGNATIYIKL